MFPFPNCGIPVSDEILEPDKIDSDESRNHALFSNDLPPSNEAVNQPRLPENKTVFSHNWQLPQVWILQLAQLYT